MEFYEEGEYYYHSNLFSLSNRFREVKEVSNNTQPES